jgi:hypothetical protein
MLVTCSKLGVARYADGLELPADGDYLLGKLTEETDTLSPTGVGLSSYR